MGTISADVRAILDKARWSPSGDNTQPWRFEILADEHVLIHGFDTRDHVVYDLDGRASQLALGTLLETLAIAATAHARVANISRRTGTADTHLLFDVRFSKDASLLPDPLVECIEKRVVQRRIMSTRPLASNAKCELEESLPKDYRLLWFESPKMRWKLAKFMFDNAKIRLNIPEAFAVHRQIIEWRARYSQDRIPEQAVGVDAITGRVMQWAMGSWARMRFMNTFLLGDLPPRLQLDLIPGIFCAGHFALLAPRPLSAVDDYLEAGRALQRFWLNATRLGLLLQPEMTPVIFTRYHRQGRQFSRVKKAMRLAENLNIRLTGLLDGQDVNQLFFMARIGSGPLPWARSTRISTEDLLVASPDVLAERDSRVDA